MEIFLLVLSVLAVSSSLFMQSGGMIQRGGGSSYFILLLLLPSPLFLPLPLIPFIFFFLFSSFSNLSLFIHPKSCNAQSLIHHKFVIRGSHGGAHLSKIKTVLYKWLPLTWDLVKFHSNMFYGHVRLIM